MNIIKAKDFFLQDLHSEILPIIDEANKLMVKGFREKTDIFIKEGVQVSTSILTQTDKDMSILLRTELKEKFPEFGFLTEESQDIPGKEFVWVIDEIDGTANFANRIPIFGTSIALWDIEKNIPVYGVISFPVQNEVIHAIHNEGVYLNNAKATRKVPKRSHTVSVFGHVGSDKEKLLLLKALTKVIPMPENYRCATFNLAMTALGRIDLAVFGNCAIWDFAAGMCIAKEAGLDVKFISDKPNLTSSTSREYKYWFVVAENSLSEKIAKKLREVYKK